MEFTVNESGCRQLSVEMLNQLKSIRLLVGSIQNMNTTLRAALGEDYESINRPVQAMVQELEQAGGELDVIIEDMKEYMARVQQVRVALK